MEHQPPDISFAVPSTAIQFETEFKKLKKDSNLFYEYFKVKIYKITKLRIIQLTNF